MAHRTAPPPDLAELTESPPDIATMRATVDRLLDPDAAPEALPPAGAELETFGTTEAIADDQKVAEVYGKKGAKVADLDEATVDKWREIARPTAWKDYAGKTPLSAELLKLAEGVQVS